MKQNRLNRMLSLLLAIVLCIGMVPVTATPAAATNLGSSEWVARNDDFSSYPVGRDSFWGSAGYTFYENYHGTYGDASYSTYGIVEEDGNKMLELVSVYETGTFFNVPKISGAHSMTLDLYMPKAKESVPGVVFSLFDGMTPGLNGGIWVYIDGDDGVRLRESVTTGQTIETYMKQADGGKKFYLDTWYTVKLSVEPGKFMVKAWPRGEQEPADDATAGVCVVEHDTALAQDVLERGMTARIQSRNRNIPGVSHTVRIDNLTFAKPYEGLSLRVLAIGNRASRDTLYYLNDLAALTGQRMECAYLELDNATLRMHARNVAKQAEEYSYYAGMQDAGVKRSINAVVEGENWDVILLQQGVEEAGIDTTYTADLQFLLDYLADVKPEAKIYWNMNWANQADTQNRKADFDRLYDGNQAIMYNAIVDCLEQFIVGEGAEYAAEFDGWFPVGAAIQNLRATAIGDNLTRDGWQLSLQAGRLTAAMAALKALIPTADLSKITPEAIESFLDTDKADLSTSFPDDPAYANTEANLALIRESVEAACADLTKAPAKLPAPAPKTVEEDTPDPDDVTVGQVTAPLSLHFGDLVVDKAGTIYTTAYECTVHVPTRNTGDYTQDGKEGPGRLKIWKSTDNGKTWDYDNPLLTIDQRQYEAWGITPDLYNRYERVKGGAEDYAYFFDGRDPNMGIMYYDMDGNGTEDEVLLYTFWGFQYMESGIANSEGTYIMYSMDGGENWSVPQRITTKHCGNGGIKRGDMAAFSDGQLLVPLYGTPIVVALLIQWDAAEQTWKTLSDVRIEDYVPEKSEEFNEASFIAPDPDGKVVHGFVRSNGQAMTSYDRGRTWQHVHTIEGNVQQPGWAYIDENRAFATWSFSYTSVRDTKGQMVYFDAGWEATRPYVIHEHLIRAEHDGGDPSSKLLANGKILTIMYDGYFRSIVGKFIDPDAPEFQLPELSDEGAEITLKRVTPDAAQLTVSDLPASHTVKTTATFAPSGKLTLTAANGAKVEFAVGDGIEANRETELRVAVINGATYVKAWPVGGAEPADWTAVKGGTAQSSGNAIFDGTGVALGDVTITRRASVTMDEGGDATAGMSAVAGLIHPADMTRNVKWSTSNRAVATVDAQGVVTFEGAGTVTITATIGDKTDSVTYKVAGAPDEVTRYGEKNVLFRDDFEGYTVGENTFYTQMNGKGYSNASSTFVEGTTYYNVVEENGNKYLELRTKNSQSAYFEVAEKFAGDFTVQFDFYRGDSNSDRWTYINLWGGTGIYGRVQMRGDRFRVQYGDAETGENITSPEFYSHDAGIWNTMKIARINGGVYIKVWPQGAPEPKGWQYSVPAEELKTDKAAVFGLSIWSKLTTDHVMLLDNLLITRQEPTNRGTFGLAVVKTIVVNGETVDICRWVWTPIKEL